MAKVAFILLRKRNLAFRKTLGGAPPAGHSWAGFEENLCNKIRLKTIIMFEFEILFSTRGL